MGCGCAIVAKSQRELIDDVKGQITKVEDEMKTANGGGEVKNKEGKAMSAEELAKYKDNLGKYLNGLREILESLQKGEFNDLGKLQDMLDQYFNMMSSKKFDDLNSLMDKIRAFFKDNCRSPPMSPKDECIKNIESLINSNNEYAKSNNLDLNDPQNEYLNIFILSLADLLDFIKTNQFLQEKECCLKNPNLDEFVKLKESKDPQALRDNLAKIYDNYRSYLKN